MTSSAVPILTAGDRHTITCTAIVEEYFVQAPSLIWEFSGSAMDTSIGEQLTNEETSTRTLTLNQIRTSQGGIYVCRATITIEGIDPLSQTTNQTIQVRSRLSM